MINGGSPEGPQGLGREATSLLNSNVISVAVWENKAFFSFSVIKAAKLQKV